MVDTVTDPETWRPIPEFEGVYEVSSRGRVRSYASMGPRGAKRRKTKPRLLSLVPRGDYVAVGLMVERKQRLFSVHRLVLEAFVGSCPPGKEARHLNGETTNNRLDNLKWGTKQENCDDRRRHGNYSGWRPKQRGCLTLEKAREIVAAPRSISHAELGRQYGVSGLHIAHIRAGKRWPEAQDAKR